MHIHDRVIAALRHDEKLGMDLADELFISRRTAWDVLSEMARAGMLFRKFRHNHSKNCPDYVYSTVPFPKRAAPPPADHMNTMLGDIDAIDFRALRR